MQTLTEQLLHSTLAGRVIDDSQLGRLIGGSAARRYGLINRALKSGELKRIRRGLYVLAEPYCSVPIHPFVVAQALAPGSYVSLETALAYHGWIPEAVYTTASIVPGRKSWSHTDRRFGAFDFYPLAIECGYFLELVERRQEASQTMLIARPARALFDLVCLRKQAWRGIGWLTEGLRIEPEHLQAIDAQQLRILKSVYKQKRVRHFIARLEKELARD